MRGREGKLLVADTGANFKGVQSDDKDRVWGGRGGGRRRTFVTVSLPPY